MSEPIYVLHAGRQTYTGTAAELEQIRQGLTARAGLSWSRWARKRETGEGRMAKAVSWLRYLLWRLYRR